MTPIVAFALVLVHAVSGAAAQQPETLSLLGEPLYAPKLSKDARTKADEALTAARARYGATPNDVDAIVALEQAHLVLGRVGDALEILTHGLEANPDDARLRLERGRGYILIRKFELAQRDLRKAEALPAVHCPLGLALYLSADYAHARESYGKCADPGVFGYLSDRRAGVPATSRPSGPLGPAPSAAPPIRFPGTTAKETDKAREPIARKYLDAIETLLDGKTDAAREALKKIVEKNRADWMDSAYIAAEADYAKIPKVKKAKGKRQKAKGRR